MLFNYFKIFFSAELKNSLELTLNKIIFSSFSYLKFFLKCRTRKYTLKKNLFMSFNCFENFLECITQK